MSTRFYHGSIGFGLNVSVDALNRVVIKYPNTEAFMSNFDWEDLWQNCSFAISGTLGTIRIVFDSTVAPKIPVKITPNLTYYINMSIS